jgi:hypothetical protein
MTDFRDAFGLAKTDPDWPDRLLHVPHNGPLTSYMHQEDNSYGGHKEPQYHILSYTWGRWMLKHPGPALHVEGILWDIPAVDFMEAFTVGQFTDVIRRIAQDVEFVWVDIACIHQTDRPAKMKEIGRQASIFEGAEQAFVWLHQWDDEQLSTQVRQLEELHSALKDHSLSYSDSDSEMLSNADDDDVPECFANASWITSAFQCLETWRSEPWFTSLWTVQEMYHKPSATLLSKSASTTTVRNQPATLRWFMECVDAINDGIRSLSYDAPFPKHLDQPRLTDVLVAADRLGVCSQIWDNSCTVFAATRHRTAWEPLDRIYGIMQVFGLRLGEAAEPNRTFTLHQLKLQLVAAITQRSPVFAQLFVHAQPPAPNETWMISEFSYTPMRLQFRDLRPEPLCEIAVDQDTSTATFRGTACAFKDFATMYKRVASATDVSESRTWQDVMFDAHTELLDILPPDILDQNRTQVDKFHETAGLLGDTFGDRLVLLSLGILQDADHRLQDGEFESEDRDLGIGMLALRVDGQGSEVLRRIGLCIWHEPDDECEVLDEFTGLWRQCESVLG